MIFTAVKTANSHPFRLLTADGIQDQPPEKQAVDMIRDSSFREALTVLNEVINFDSLAQNIFFIFDVSIAVLKWRCWNRYSARRSFRGKF